MTFCLTTREKHYRITESWCVYLSCCLTGAIFKCMFYKCWLIVKTVPWLSTSIIKIHLKFTHVNLESHLLAGNVWINTIPILEIVDQLSTRIPPPHRRGWQWAMGGLQLKIVPNHKAAIFESDIADNRYASAYSHKGHAHEIWNWNSKANLSYAVETMPSRNRKI